MGNWLSNENKRHLNKETKMYIARFLSIKDAEYVLNEDSTFCLNSLRYYRNVKQDSIQDKMELFIKSKCGEGELLNNFLVSCWTMLEKEKPNNDEWNIFSDKNDIAIVSVVETVDKFLREKFQLLLDKKVFVDYQHKRVDYYDESKEVRIIAEELGIIKSDSNDDKDYICFRLLLHAPFLKRKKHTEEKEYRFVFRMSDKINLQRIVLYAKSLYDNGPVPYIKSIWINPLLYQEKVSGENKKKIHNILSSVSEAGLPLSIVGDLDEVVKYIQSF